LIGFGSVGVAASDGANQQLQVRVQVGSDNGTGQLSGGMETNEDRVVYASHSASVTGNVTVAIQSTIVTTAVSSLTFRHANIAWYAVRTA
jgi:osmotically-inducible protein OsmY